MDIIQAIILGIIQGLTEFIPISSTAHLTLFGKLFGLIDPEHPENWTAFIAIVQLGTAAAVIIYFQNDYLVIGKSLLNDMKKKNIDTSNRWSHESRMALKILIATIPISVIGLVFKDFIHGTFTKEISTIGVSLITLAIILFIAEKIGKHKKTEEQTTIFDAFIVGFAQAIALIPGSSRSGTTITAGLFLGLNRETAARFSFHLSIPAILASGFFEMYEVRHHLSDLGILQLTISTVIAGIVGYLSIAFLLRYLRTHTTYLFIIYRVILGIILLMFFI